MVASARFDLLWSIAVVDSFPVTRVSLLCRLKDPIDGGAWKTFVDAYGPLVYGEIRRRGLSEPDAEDITQEVFSRCLRSIRQFENDRRKE